LYEQIVSKAKECGLSGATVKRGIMGFLGNGQISKPKILTLSENLPVVIEIIDIEIKINQFLPKLDEMIKEGLITLEKVEAVNRHA